jgi:oxepin-CoA hydrolase / 3-oxo-5,6-dehydrosuberyl-CoA semialdehyde dehydrogenase
MSVLQSFIAGQWLGETPARALPSAVNGDTVAHTHEESIDFAQAVDYARRIGVKNLLALDFQQRAAILKELAIYIQGRKDELYAISHHTGCTKADSWIDIDGGFGTLFTYASTGRKELPSGNVAHEGPVTQLGKDNHFNGTHILVPRRGVSVHINAFNFPIWGMLEKFAPAFLAGMPCIVKPATATSYLTEAAVRVINDAGLLPEGALQLIIGGTGDLLDRLEEQDFVTFTGSASTALKLKSHPNLMAKSIPFNAEADSLNSAIMAPDVTPDDDEFDIFAREVVKEMTAKAGQKCTAIRRVLVPAERLDALVERLTERLDKITFGNPAEEGVRMGALASRDQLRDVTDAIERLLATSECVYGRTEGLKPVGEGVENGRLHRPPPAGQPQPAERRRRPRHRGLRPGDDPDALPRHRRGPGPRRQGQGQPGHHPDHPGPGHRRRDDPGAGRPAWPPAYPRCRSVQGVHRARLTAANAQARRPRARRRRRRTRRHPRGASLPAAHRHPGLAHHGRRGDP